MKKSPSSQTLLKNLYEYRRKQVDIEWEQKNPIQKIGTRMRSIMGELNKIEAYLREAKRIKKEHGVSSDKYWVRTRKSFIKAETKIKRLTSHLRDLRG